MDDTDKDIAHLGQCFTPQAIAEKMLALRQNRGRVLEPACGDGAFLRHLEPSATGIEIDGRWGGDARVHVGDFFAYPLGHKFDTIIGNPPYVRYRDIGAATKSLLTCDLFDKRSNLYLFFIAKSMCHLNEGGEIIFITPRDFLKSTSAGRLNAALYAMGSFTHYYELGDARIFDGVAPNCAIWRWQLGRKQRRMATGGSFRYAGGQIWFGESAAAPGKTLGDYFDIKVGAVSGADDIFAHADHGNVDMVGSKTITDGKTRRMIYNTRIGYLEKYKPALLGRRIRHFTEHNWWEWGRRYHARRGERIYVNVKTRNPRPFYVHDAEAYDGSVMALFPKRPAHRNNGNLRAAADMLNDQDWNALGFVCDGRHIFTQRSLAGAPLCLT